MRFINYFLFKIRKIKIGYIVFIFFSIALCKCDLIEDIEVRNIESLKNLNVNNVSVIEVFEKGKLLIRKDMAQEIKEFTNCLNDLKKFHPNHPHYLKEWFVSIKLLDGSEEKLYLMKEKNDDENLYVNPLGHRWLGGGGTASSKLLYKWMVDNKLVGISGTSLNNDS